jgi:hypothetical protein
LRPKARTLRRSAATATTVPIVAAAAARTRCRIDEHLFHKSALLDPVTISDELGDHLLHFKCLNHWQDGGDQADNSRLGFNPVSFHLTQSLL